MSRKLILSVLALLFISLVASVASAYPYYSDYSYAYPRYTKAFSYDKLTDYRATPGGYEKIVTTTKRTAVDEGYYMAPSAYRYYPTSYYMPNSNYYYSQNAYPQYHYTRAYPYPQYVYSGTTYQFGR